MSTPVVITDFGESMLGPLGYLQPSVFSPQSGEVWIGGSSCGAHDHYAISA